MRRILAQRDDQYASNDDLELSGQARAFGLDEPASFAPRTPSVRPGINNLEAFVLDADQTPWPLRHSRRDLTALQLVEAAEAAMRLATAERDPGSATARTFDILSLIDHVVAEARPKAAALGVVLSHSSTGETAPVIGESSRLGQVLSKLVSGALAARGVAALSLEHSAFRRGDCLISDIIVHLRREGDEAVVARAPNGSAEFDAHGEVGMSLSPSLVHAVAGVDGEVTPSGTDLCVTLRLRLQIAPPAQPTAAKVTLPEITEESALRGMRMLLVEDMDLNRALLGMLLSPYGCELVEAANGREALEAVEAQDFDVILMDLQLPEMDGFEAMRRIRARQDARAATPILAVSGRAMAADVAQALAAGADGHLAKPYATHDLVAAIVKCRREAGAEDGSRAAS